MTRVAASPGMGLRIPNRVSVEDKVSVNGIRCMWPAAPERLEESVCMEQAAFPWPGRVHPRRQGKRGYSVKENDHG